MMMLRVVNGKLLPMITGSEAQTEAVNELIWALEHRPRDFETTRYVLRDTTTKHEWWIGIGRFGLWKPNGGDEDNVKRVGIVNATRARWAIRKWHSAQTPTKLTPASCFHEALMDIKRANKEANRDDAGHADTR